MSKKYGPATRYRDLPISIQITPSTSPSPSSPHMPIFIPLQQSQVPTTAPNYKRSGIPVFTEREIKISPTATHYFQAPSALPNGVIQFTPGRGVSKTSVVIPSARIPVSVEIHPNPVPNTPPIITHPSSSSEANEQQTHSNDNNNSRQNNHQSERPPPKKARTDSEDSEAITVMGSTPAENSSEDPHGTSRSGHHNVPSSRNKINGYGPSIVIGNGCPPVPRDMLSTASTSANLDTIAEEADNHKAIPTRKRLSISFRTKVGDDSQDVESGPPELRVPPVNHRRRSSLIAFENFLKSKIGWSEDRMNQPRASRTSIVSRLSFSSDRDHQELRVTNFNRMTDLRKMLNQEVEKEDFFTNFWSRFYSCEWFEWNLNNAAKLITIGVFVITIIMIVRAILTIT